MPLSGNAASVAAAIGPQVAALCQRLFARGVNRRRSDASAAPPSDPAQPDRAAALTAEERHPVDPARSSDPVLPASGSARACGPRLALGADPARRRAPGGGASPARVRPAGRRSPGWATISRLGDDLKVIERDLARSALGNVSGGQAPTTIPAVDMVVAPALTAAIGASSASPNPRSWLAISGSTRACGNPDRDRPTTGGSPNRGVGTPAACRSRAAGPRRGRQARYAASFRAYRPGAGSTSPPSRRHANSPS